MTIADMSLITAEVDVDETDIVSVQLGQTAEVTIEAMPNQTFTGKVIEIGNTAIVRSSGLGGVAKRDFDSGSQGFQGGGGAGPSARRNSSGAFGDRENHHGDPA